MHVANSWQPGFNEINYLNKMYNYLNKQALVKLLWFFSVILLPGFSHGLDFKSGNFQQILNNRSEILTVWSYQGNSEIYVFDFPGLIMQGRTFNRVTQLTEQTMANAGYPSVLIDEELTKYIESVRRTPANFAFGHDVLVSELTLFFNLADRDKVELLPEEIQLREFLSNQGFIKLWRGFYQALKPGVVILSIPQVQSKKTNEPEINELARRAIFTHEISHAEYYTNPYYANYCRRYWNETLTDEQRSTFIEFFKKYNYDVGIVELVINEMQAYLMFTSDPNSFNATKLGVTDEELESMRTAFRRGNPPTKLPLR